MSKPHLAVKRCRRRAMKKVKRCRTCGFCPCRCEDLEAGYMGASNGKGWPLVCTALAVHPKQVKEANARNKRHGVGVVYRPDGKAVIPDAGEYRRLRKLEGVHMNESFTGN